MLTNGNEGDTPDVIGCSVMSLSLGCMETVGLVSIFLKVRVAMQSENRQVVSNAGCRWTPSVLGEHSRYEGVDVTSFTSSGSVT
jgi:hypothetical protein